MLRALPTAAATSQRAIEVARRVGEPAAEVNARINLFTDRAPIASLPSTDDISEVIDLALGAGAPDEAVRAVVNYLWSAALLGPIGPAEEVVSTARAATGAGPQRPRAYDEYLQLSLAVLVYVPAGSLGGGGRRGRAWRGHRARRTGSSGSGS